MGAPFSVKIEIEIPDPTIIAKLLEDLNKAIAARCDEPVRGPSWSVFSCEGTLVKLSGNVPEPQLLMLPPSKIYVQIESTEPVRVKSISEVVAGLIQSEYRGLASSRLLL